MHAEEGLPAEMSAGFLADSGMGFPAQTDCPA
jgi:hypothetical protein